ncbi:aminopeptidase P family N-terminal domain-containing protein [Flavobacterium sp. N502536]|uniref:aminopeptidase P family N-terminal domain-containing protein n=1 Tax=Flavobacterium sp. N502536 TaxID=2986837 RepID=UPI0022215408|nr:aminopeptidase P family N-terminal domain-containing protein [Flavobacterium sp. N502536]
MTIGVGGSNAIAELEKIQDMTLNVKAIQPEEYQTRIDKAVSLIKTTGFKAVFLNAGTNLYYFTGTKWNPSERMVGALLFEDGSLEYIVPKFEEGTFRKFMQIDGHLNCWEEHESPSVLFGKILQDKGVNSGKIALDESAGYFLVDAIVKANPGYDFENSQPITTGCRIQKSANEIAIIQQVKEITMVVQRAAARILHPV